MCVYCYMFQERLRKGALITHLRSYSRTYSLSIECVLSLSHTLVHTLDLSLCPHHHQNCSRSFRPCLMRTHFRHRTASSAPTTVFWERSASSNTIHAHVNVLPSTNSETISTSARNMQAPRLAHTSTYSQEWARSG